MTATDMANIALEALVLDRKILTTVDRYLNGDHDLPFAPEQASTEFMQLRDRSLTNWIPMLCAAPAQAMYVDSFRRNGSEPTEAVESPEMLHWQRSRLDSRQVAVHRAAIAYGVAYTRTYRGKDGKAYTKGLSPLQTITIYDDPATDLDPVGAVYVKTWESGQPIEGVFYDSTHEYPFTINKDGKAVLGRGNRHGMSQCPITRFAPWLDLMGRPTGMVDQLIPTQDRFTQTIFDLLMAQSYTATNVRTATGMTPPMKRELGPDGKWRVVTDQNGDPVPDQVQMNGSRILYAENPEAKFGTLPAGDLSGFMSAAEAALKHMSSIAQVPPHFLLGQIANVSAEALQAAQTSMLRMVDEIQHGMGESWERTFRLAAEIEGYAGSDDYSGEVIWKDVGGANMGQIGDALGKFASELEVPVQGLWGRIPGVTDQELLTWKRLAEEADTERQIMDRAYGSGIGERLSAPVPDPEPNPVPIPGQRPFAGEVA